MVFKRDQGYGSSRLESISEVNERGTKYSNIGFWLGDRGQDFHLRTTFKQAPGLTNSVTKLVTGVPGGKAT